MHTRCLSDMMLPVIAPIVLATQVTKDTSWQLVSPHIDAKDYNTANNTPSASYTTQDECRDVVQIQCAMPKWL